MTSPCKLILASMVAVAASAGAAQAELKKVVFGTNWLAQAEHGGFYQSVADGTYEACGLDVEIIPGGPQVNNRALLLAGKLDFHMGSDILALFNAAKEDIPVVAVAAMFQKIPQVILAHPGEADTFEELKELDTLLIGDNGFATYYQWLIAAHGFQSEKRAPYTFNPAPFIADKRAGMQGYLSSEPFAVEKEAGFKPNVFLLADYGYATYATTIETMAGTIESDPEAVECFVDGSITGWYNFLYGDSSAADALIKADNPDMTQDKIDFAKTSMMENGILESGDALELGIGAMSDEVIKDFYEAMVAAGVIEEGLDYSAVYTLDFTNKKVGMELRQ